MPASAFNPDQLAEMIALYTAGGETIDTLAARYGADRTTVARRLRKAGCTVRKYSPFSANIIACPFSPDRLRELYWKEARSLSEIMALASAILDRPIGQRTLQRWMKEAAIPPRTLQEAQRVRVKNHPEQWVAPLRALAASAHTGPASGPPKCAIKRGVAAAATLRKKTGWQTRPCARPGCNRTSTRRKSEFSQPPENTYCSHSCANMARSAKRRAASELARLQAANPALAQALLLIKG